MTTTERPVDPPGPIPTEGLELRPGMSFEEWSDLGAKLVKIEQNAMWWLGEWWLYGEREYGEAAAAALPTGFAADTIRQAAWVAERFVPNRYASNDSLSPKHENLSFTHHRQVAALPPAEREELLTRAEDESLTTRELYAEVQRKKSPEIKAEDRIAHHKARISALLESAAESWFEAGGVVEGSSLFTYEAERAFFRIADLRAKARANDVAVT